MSVHSYQGLHKSLPRNTSPILQGIFALIGLCIVFFGGFDLWQRSVLYFEDSELTASIPVAQTQEYMSSATAVTPSRLIIPSIGVAASIETVGKTSTGAMATPKKFTDAAWYSLGAKPGEEGNAVFAGHVNNALTLPGVFEHLSDVKTGDTIIVSDAKGSARYFKVTKVSDYSTTDAPLSEIFSSNGPSGIVLITCAGDWNAHAHSFDKRLVVYARLVA